MIRRILAIMIGFGLWTVIWLVGHVMVLKEATKMLIDRRTITEPRMLWSIIGLSAACSIAAGLCCAVISGRSRVALVMLTGLLLLTGAVVQLTAWSLYPLWFHAVFLGLIFPMTWIGARLWKKTTPHSHRGA